MLPLVIFFQTHILAVQLYKKENLSMISGILNISEHLLFVVFCLRRTELLRVEMCDKTLYIG